MNRNLTEGRPESVLWRFSLPMFISAVFQQLYNIADSVIAGKFAGEDALAAIGASYPVTMIFMSIALGSNIGCSVIISQLFGAQRLKELKTAVNTSVISSFILSAVLTIGGLLGSTAMMRLIKTPENIFADGILYLRIYIGGFLFLFLYNICTGIFTSLGDSRTPLFFLIGSSLGNVFLDWLFVAVFHQGVAGVAWATFIAQGIACMLAVMALIRRIQYLHAEKGELFSPRMLKQITRIAVPSILQQSFISIGNIFIQTLVNGYGSAVVAGYSAAIKLNTFTITSFTTLANGMSAFTAQNVGAGFYDRIKKGYRAGMMMMGCIALPFFIGGCFFSRSMLMLFLSDPASPAVTTGAVFLQIVSPFYPIIGVKLMADGVLRGSGAMREFMIATFTDLILRVILSYVFSSTSLAETGIWLSWPVGWIVATVLSVIFYTRGKWKDAVKA